MNATKYCKTVIQIKFSVNSCFCKRIFSVCGDLLCAVRDYWRQKADERLGDPLPTVDPGAFSDKAQLLTGHDDQRTLHQLKITLAVSVTN